MILAWLTCFYPSQPYRGLFRGEFILDTYAVHFSACQGAKKVPALIAEDTPGPVGALGMSAAAVRVYYAQRKLLIMSAGRTSIHTCGQWKSDHRGGEEPPKWQGLCIAAGDNRK